MIGIDFLEFATKTDFDVDEFIQFKKEMFGLRGSLKTSHFYEK